MYFMFFSQSTNRLTCWFPSNQVFYQSDCELVTFDTVELFFLRKKKSIYLYNELEVGAYISLFQFLSFSTAKLYQ